MADINIGLTILGCAIGLGLFRLAQAIEKASPYIDPDEEDDPGLGRCAPRPSDARPPEEIALPPRPEHETRDYGRR